jgi:hypothetical protein
VKLFITILIFVQDVTEDLGLVKDEANLRRGNGTVCSRFITVFTTARYWSLSLSPLRLDLPNSLFPSGFPTKKCD